jgi:hypothetical protein
MADRTPEKRDALLGTGDAVLELPIPENPSEHYMRSRLAAEKALREDRIVPIDDGAPDETPSRNL